MVSSRMAKIAAMVIKGKTTADIGTDHARLALYMVAEGITPKMIISDLPAGPFNRACEAVASSPFRDRIEVRQGNGLQVLKPGEVFNIIIAGMGGDTIVDILSFDHNKARSFIHYTFQPMSKPQVLRKFLASQGWPITKEEIIKENEHFYVIINACPGEKPYSMSLLEMDIGPCILKNPAQEHGKEYLHRYLKKYRSAKEGMEQSGKNGRDEIIAEYEKKICRLGEILNEC